MIEFDIILDEIGHLGKYQFQIISMVYWVGIPAALHALAAVFYSAPIPYRCNVSPIDNGTIYPNLSEAQILNLTTPYDDANKRYDTCTWYGYDLELCDGTDGCVNKSTSPIPCDTGYNFDTSTFTNTIATEWDIVCERKVLNAIATSLFFAGMWAGALISGYISDNYGRRTALFYCNIGTLVFGLIVTFSPWFTLFTIARFCVAATSHGSNLTMAIYVIEVSGKHRTRTGIFAHVPFAVGSMLCTLISYFFRDWRHYYFVLTLFSLPYFVFHYFVPESPRWLFAKGQPERGKQVCYKFARGNGKMIEEGIWERATTTKKDVQRSRRYSSVHLFKPFHMRLITINVMFSWFVISLVYFGLALNAGNLSGNIFVNNCLNGIVEIPACFLVISTMDRIGRVRLLSSVFIFGGLTLIGNMLCTLFANGNQAIVIIGIVLVLAGKLFAAAAFDIIFNFSAELYPTMLRSNGMGVGSMAARWGSILSPFVILLNHSHPWFLATFFGSLSLLAGLLALLYPETMNKSMPQTMEEAKMLYKGRSINHNTQTPEDAVALDEMEEKMITL